MPPKQFFEQLLEQQYEETYFKSHKAFIVLRIKEHNKRILTKKMHGLMTDRKYEVWEDIIEPVEGQYHLEPVIKFETFNERYDYLG